MVIVYSNNDSPEWRDQAVLFAGNRYPAAQVVVRNPDVYQPGQRQSAQAIVIPARYEAVIADHDGVPVHTESDVYVVPAPVELKPKRTVRKWQPS